MLEREREYNGNQSKLRNIDIKEEYDLIKQKKSNLPANVRLMIVRTYERNQSPIQGERE